MFQKISELMKQQLEISYSELINKFIRESTPENAIEIAKIICKPNNKDIIIRDLLKNLLSFENGRKKGRDHVKHAVHTYLLGMIIIGAMDDLNNDEFKFIWKIASLFHDIGYERANYFSEISSTSNLHIDHGIFSAQITWVILYSEYIKANPKKTRGFYPTKRNGVTVNSAWENIERYILPACEAILLHDNPLKHNKNNKVSYRNNKCAFLLIICDALQMWRRSKKCDIGLDQGTSSELYQIEGPNNNGDCYKLSMVFPDVAEAINVAKELNEKCDCEAVPQGKVLEVKWNIR